MTSLLVVSRRFILTAAFLTSSSALLAAPIVFSGQDNSTAPNPQTPPTNSLAAANSFYAAAALIGNVSTITLESAPVGSFTNLVVAPGVTISGSDDLGNPQTIRNVTDFPAYPPVDGTNTTPGGTNFIEVEGGTVTFTFANPTQFFGAYFTGVQTNFFPDVITFSDGTSESINLPGTGTTNSTGALDFVGFTDAGKSISSVTFTASQGNSGADFLGIDDIAYESPAPVVPEPSSIVLLLTGMGGVGLQFKRRFTRHTT